MAETFRGTTTGGVERKAWGVRRHEMPAGEWRRQGVEGGGAEVKVLYMRRIRLVRVVLKIRSGWW